MHKLYNKPTHCWAKPGRGLTTVMPGTRCEVPAQTEGGPPRHQTPPSPLALHPPAYGQVSSTAFAPERQTGTTHPCGCLHGNTLRGRREEEDEERGSAVKRKRSKGWKPGSSVVWMESFLWKRHTCCCHCMEWVKCFSLKVSENGSP